MAWEEIVISVAVENLVKNHKSLIQKLKILFKSNRRIIVFGSSGTGKTQFVESFIDNNFETPQRTFATSKRKLSLDEYPIIFADTPGHELGKDFRDKERDYIIKEGVEGIINVVSYGYHESPDYDRNVAIEGEDIQNGFLKNNLKIEREQLKDWLPFLQESNVKWIITLVTKADVWWDQKVTIENYYTKGKYKTNFKKDCGKIKNIVIPYCSLIKPFYGIKLSKSFGDQEKIRLKNHFYKTFLNLLGKVR